MTNDVHVGRDGWLFLSGGSNDVLKFYTAPGFFDSAAMAWMARMQTRRASAASLGASYRHITIPDKLTVYREMFCDPLPFPELAPAIALPELLKRQPDGEFLMDCIVDILEPMIASKSAGNQLYWKTDSHWTFEGSYVAYLELCRSIDAKPQPSIPDAPALSGSLVLDLGGKLNPPVHETYVVKHFFRDAKRTFANDLVLYKERENAHNAPGLHVGSHVVFRNDVSATDPRTIVLFGDSYSEYRTHQLTGLLAETFAETHFIWSSSIDWAYVRSVAADIVMTEMAERFMNIVPPDEIAIDRFAADRLKEYLASRQP